MKLLIALALVLTIASAFDLRGAETNSSSAVVPAIKKEGRIFNGRTAKKGQFPYQVGLRFGAKNSPKNWCGGSLIGREWVLTAAHCVFNEQSVSVRLGALERKKPVVSFTVSNEKFIIHPQWNRKTLFNDIALIQIPPVSVSKTIQVIKLPARTDSKSSLLHKSVIASGWGKTSPGDKVFSEVLRYAQMTVIQNSACKLPDNEPFTQKLICAAARDGGSVCIGDSGGPLVLKSNKVQIGVVSLGYKDGCGFPALFTRLSNYLDWIHSHTGIAY